MQSKVIYNRRIACNKEKENAVELTVSTSHKFILNVCDWADNAFSDRQSVISLKNPDQSTTRNDMK